MEEEARQALISGCALASGLDKRVKVFPSYSIPAASTDRKFNISEHCGPSVVSQWVRAFATKPNDLSS